MDGFPLWIVEIHHSPPAHRFRKPADRAPIAPKLSPSPVLEMEGVQWY
jgi:hypothetical protein